MLTKLDTRLSRNHFGKTKEAMAHLIGIKYVAQQDKCGYEESLVLAVEGVIALKSRAAVLSAEAKARMGTLTVRDILLMIKPDIDELHTLLSELEAPES